MIRVSSRWCLAALAVAALGLGACANQDASGEDVTKVLKEAGASQEQADCAGESFAKELDQDERNKVAKADDLDDLSDGLRTKVDAIMNECFAAQGPETDGDSDSTDATTTTTQP